MAKHDWRDLERRYLTGEFLNLVDLSKKTGISYSLARQRAAKEEWQKKRHEIEQNAVTEIQSQLKLKMARAAEKRLPALLDLADALKGKALQTLSQESLRLLPSDALRALRNAADIELELLAPRGDRRREVMETEPMNGAGETIIDEQPKATLDRKLRRLIAGKDPGPGAEGAK